MVFPIPRFAVLKSQQSGKYLSYVRDDPKTRGFIQSSGDYVASPFAKFELEPAETGSGNGLTNVHIKSCYNSKYWCLLSEHLPWVVAGSDKKVEDKTKWSCTLFEPIIESDKDKTIRLRHLHLGFCLRLDAYDQSHQSMLVTGGESSKTSDVFKVIDAESLALLPNHVAFKGDNGKYLGVSSGAAQLLQFAFTNTSDKPVGFEVSNEPGGNISIKSNFNDKYWKAQSSEPYWVSADSDVASKDLFYPDPDKFKENTITLTHVSTKKFSQRFTGYGEDDCLAANALTSTNQAQLVYVEIALSRAISNIQYHINEFMISSGCQEEIIGLGTLSATNPSDQTDTIPLTFEYTDTSTTNWSTHYDITFGVKVEFEAGIPLIGNPNIEVSALVTGGHQWGRTTETTGKINAGYTATVPPKSMVTVTLKATKASCRIPFSYTQRDTFTNGEQIISDKDDGIYTGNSYFNFDFQKETKPISTFRNN